jgi:hypothetical protein
MAEAAPMAVAASAPVAVAAAPAGRSSRAVRCGPGESMSHPRPGDVILVRGVGWLGRLIRLGERISYRGDADRAFAYWSHAALVVSRAGHLIEVLPAGVCIGTIERYRDQDYHYVCLDLPEADRARAARFAYSCLRQKYDRWSFALLAVARLLGDRFEVPDRGCQQGCVSLIVRALQAAGMRFERRPTDMSLVDLAKRLGVMP